MRKENSELDFLLVFGLLITFITPIASAGVQLQSTTFYSLKYFANNVQKLAEFD